MNRLVRPSRTTVRGTRAAVRSRTSSRRCARSSAAELETWYTRTPGRVSRRVAARPWRRTRGATLHGAATLSTRLLESGT